MAKPWRRTVDDARALSWQVCLIPWHQARKPMRGKEGVSLASRGLRKRRSASFTSLSSIVLRVLGRERKERGGTSPVWPCF